MIGNLPSWAMTIVTLLTVIVGFYFLSEPFLTSEKQKISGFHGYEWGTTAETIVSDLGAPNKSSYDTSTKTPSMHRRLIYTRQPLQGETGTITFTFDPDKGLVQGFYYIPFERGDDCRNLFTKFRTFYQQNFSSLSSNDARFNNLKVKFCYAVKVGHAGWFHQWQDEAENRVILLLGYGFSPSDLVIAFESRHVRDKDRLLSRVNRRQHSIVR